MQILLLLLSFLFTVIYGKYAIDSFRNLQGKGQPIRNDGPESHLKKVGTPTMGGIIIISSILIIYGIFSIITERFNITISVVLFVMISYGIIGFLDDYAKIKKQSANGIKAKLRLVFEFFIAGIALWIIQTKINPVTTVNIPFIQNGIELGVFYYILASLAIVGTANATNLTDGLDGLLIGPVIMTFICFLSVIYMCIYNVYSDGKFGLILTANEMIDLSMFCIIFIGVSLGFLWYNANPAKIFMGDVGSLAIGGAIGTIAVLLRQEVFLLIIGGVFVAEALSVIIQVASYKKRRKRVFLMAPIHHHFEKMGIQENTVVMRFWIINLLLCVLGIYFTII